MKEIHLGRLFSRPLAQKGAVVCGWFLSGREFLHCLVYKTDLKGLDKMYQKQLSLTKTVNTIDQLPLGLSTLKPQAAK